MCFCGPSMAFRGEVFARPKGGKLMIQVTQGAATEIKKVLTANQAAQDRGLKLVPAEKGAVSLTIDKAQPGDAVLKDGDRPLLIVDSTITRRLDDAILDVSMDDDKRDEASRFVLRSHAGA
jgi:hypothetical protein